MVDNYRFHVTLGESKKTTVSLGKHLLTLFSLKQGWDLYDQKTLHKNIRIWCNETLRKNDYTKHAIHFSQYLQRNMIEAIAEKEIVGAYNDLFSDDDDYCKIKF